MKIVFEWNKNADIGHYDCTVYEVEGESRKKIDSIFVQDYTNEWQQQNAKENRYFRQYAFEVHWCNGWSMHTGFGSDENYKNHRDENGKIVFGYSGTCKKTLKDVMRWCEEWLAQRYIAGYEDILARLEEMKNRSEALKEQGYGNLNLDDKE